MVNVNPGSSSEAAEVLDVQKASGTAAAEERPAAKVLLADDRPQNLLALEAVLGDLGQTLVTADSGGEALRCLLRDDYAVVLLDVQMPDMDGFEIARLIRERERSRHTPIIFITAHEQSEPQVARAYSLGAVDFLFKPIIPAVLRAKVTAFVELFHQREAVRRQAELLRETQRREHERRLAEERQTWEMERLRAEAAKDRRVAEELAEADRRKDEFLAMLGHELRNPLAPILNALHVLRVQGGGPEAGGVIDLIERQARHMTRLIDDLLDVSRITQGRIDLRRQTVAVSDVVNRAVEAATPLVESRRHRLAVKVPSEPVWLEADPTRLEQVLSNLLNNAAKYTEPGGRIDLVAEREGPGIAVRVRDSGIGIAAEMLPGVFDLFMQADRSLDRSQGGLGVGLTLAKRLTEMHGGTLEARSEGPGKGSEFVVRLPRLASAPREREAGPGPSPTAGRRRVLVVDDHRDVLESVSMLLRLDGHEVCTASDGEKAMTAWRTFAPQIVLLDIGLPGMSGYEVARRMRREGEEALLVAMTGYGQDQDRSLCHEAGFDLHLVKPVDPETLRQMLASLPLPAKDKRG